MRMTSTTSSPVIANERTAAGPAALMTTPLPTKRPAPMTPPRAIMVMCRCFRPWRSPLACEGVLFVRLVLTVTFYHIIDVFPRPQRAGFFRKTAQWDKGNCYYGARTGILEIL